MTEEENTIDSTNESGVTKTYAPLPPLIMRQVIVLATAINALLAMILWTTFLFAYINGGYIVVTINEYGEANVELFMACIIIPITLLGSYVSCKYFIKDE